MMSQQLVFPLPSKSAFGREDYFVSQANHLAVSTLETPAQWPLSKLGLVGPAGAGKTHLAHVWAADQQAQVLGAAELHALDLTKLPVAPLVVEDIDRIVGHIESEQMLFHLHNIMQSREAFLLFTASTPPNLLAFATPDLKSRLVATTIVSLQAPDDALLTAVLMKMFADRQISPAPGLLCYIMARIDRSFDAARTFVETFDHAALAEKRPIGKRLAKEVLDQMRQGQKT